MGLTEPERVLDFKRFHILKIDNISKYYILIIKFEIY